MASQNTQRQFRGVKSMRELAEAPTVTAFRLRFEAGRSFDLDDDLEFCPNLLTEDDVREPSPGSSVFAPETLVVDGDADGFCSCSRSILPPRIGRPYPAGHLTRLPCSTRSSPRNKSPRPSLFRQAPLPTLTSIMSLRPP